MQITQRLASQLIAAVLTEGRNLTDALRQVFQAHPDLTAQQRGAIQDIAYGTVRFYGPLNLLLGLLSNKPVSDDKIRYLLLVGLYQLVYTKAKPYAIVDSAVTLARRHKQTVGGLVNAILRNFLRNRETLWQTATTEDPYSHPQWWRYKLRTQYPNDWEAILQTNNMHPLFTLRVNLQKTSQKAYLKLLETAGMTAEPLGTQAIRLEKAVPVKDLPLFAEGYVSVQDYGAQRAAQLLDLTDGMRVLDACAAPGGKTGHMLELADVEMLALDKEASRLVRVDENLTRLGLKATLCRADATSTDGWWDGVAFDRILADVPCSASGVVRRHPDIKWLRREADIARFGVQQREILDTMWQCLRSGGKLLYATCSVFSEENSQQVEAFLTRHPEAKCLGEEKLIPDQDHDGFYYALLEKS
jgi:16S rRNA (cytosine967-C5)-methyltransferase